MKQQTDGPSPISLESSNTDRGAAKVTTRLRIRQSVLFRGTPAEVVTLQPQHQVVVRDLHTGTLHTALAADLLTFEDDGRYENESCEHRATNQEWEQAQRRSEFVSKLAVSAHRSVGDVRAVAEQLGVSERQVRRWVTAYRQGKTTASLLLRKPGRKPGSKALDPRVDTIIEERLRRCLRISADVTISTVLPAIQEQCRQASLSVPGKATVARRLQQLRRLPDLLPAEVRKASKEARRLILDHFTAEHALDLVQIDHTVVDVIVVDGMRGDPIGRPTLTLAIDLKTRCCLGMYLSLEPPSALSVAMCLTHAVRPKTQWLSDIGAAGPWEMFGVMRTLHCDNGREFHSHALERGCSRFDIRLQFRPPATPRFGGAIERLFGTLMPRLQLLPGATYSRALGKRPKDAQQSACITLNDLECFIANEITRYHHERHRELQATPASVWDLEFRTSTGLVTPRTPVNLRDFYLSFLPGVYRTVTREGIDLDTNEYWCQALSVREAEKQFVRFDPRDMRRVYLHLESGEHLEVPIRDSLFPQLSRREWAHIRRQSRIDGRTHSAEMVAAAARSNMQQLESASRKSLRARQRLARATQADAAMGDPVAAAGDVQQPEPSAPIPIHQLPFEIMQDGLENEAIPSSPHAVSSEDTMPPVEYLPFEVVERGDDY